MRRSHLVDLDWCGAGCRPRLPPKSYPGARASVVCPTVHRQERSRCGRVDSRGGLPAALGCPQLQLPLPTRLRPSHVPEIAPDGLIPVNARRGAGFALLWGGPRPRSAPVAPSAPPTRSASAPPERNDRLSLCYILNRQPSIDCANGGAFHYGSVIAIARRECRAFRFSMFELRMRESPPIIPWGDVDRTVYLVLNDFAGAFGGLAWPRLT
jgi:hypothetical protein